MRSQRPAPTERRERLPPSCDCRCETLSTGTSRAAGSVQDRALTGQAHSQPPELPGSLPGLDPEPFVQRRCARESLYSCHRLVERGRAQDHGDRVGLALDVQFTEEDRNPFLGCTQGAAHDLRPLTGALFGAGKLGRALLEVRQIGLCARQRRFGRVQLEERS